MSNVLNGFAGSAIGASGSTNALEGKSGWYLYVCERGAYASAASTGVLISVDSNDERNRFAANDWVQIGTDTSKIRQVDNITTLNKIEVTSAVNVSQNDRILLVGSTQPTVTGGSASYQPNTTIYNRGNDAGTPISKSKLTTDSSGNYVFHATDGFYDIIAQDANQSNQLILSDVPVGLATSGSLIADSNNTREFGATTTLWRNIYYSGSVFNGISDGTGTTAFNFVNIHTEGLTQGNLFAFGLSQSVLVYGDTYGGINDSWNIPSMVNIKSSRFGAKGDGSTDDTAAIAAGITFAKTTVSGSQGAQVYFPKGTYVVNSSIFLPSQVGIIGENGRGSIIQAGGSFPADSPLVRLGNNTATNAHNCMVEKLNLDCNQKSGSIGVYSTEANEGSGVVNCLIQNYEDAGIFFSGQQVQNIRVENVEAYHTNAAANGISFNTIAGKNLVTHVSTNSNNSTQSTGYGIGITASHVAVIGHHMEHHDVGCLYGINATGTYMHADGHSTVDAVLKIDQQGVMASDISANGSTVTVWDNVSGISLTASLSNSGGWYFLSNDVAVGGTKSIWTSATEGTNQVNPSIVFGGTASWGAQRFVQTAGLMTGPPFESVAAAGTVTISSNRIAMTGGATTISTINPATSDMEGTEIVIQNQGSGQHTYDENGNILIGGAATNAVTVGDMVRFILVGTTWYQSGSRQDH